MKELRSARRWLWLGLFFLAPVPIFILGPGWVPTARLAMLGAIAGALVLFENGRGAAPLVVLVFAGHVVVYGLLFWILAHLATRPLRRLRSPRPRTLVWGLLALAIGVASSVEIYEGPYRVSRMQASLLDVYE